MCSHCSFRWELKTELAQIIQSTKNQKLLPRQGNLLAKTSTANVTQEAGKVILDGLSFQKLEEKITMPTATIWVTKPKLDANRKIKSWMNDRWSTTDGPIWSDNLNQDTEISAESSKSSQTTPTKALVLYIYAPFLEVQQYLYIKIHPPQLLIQSMIILKENLIILGWNIWTSVQKAVSSKLQCLTETKTWPFQERPSHQKI